MRNTTHHTLSFPLPGLRVLVAPPTLGAGGISVPCAPAVELDVAVVASVVWADVPTTVMLVGSEVVGERDGVELPVVVGARLVSEAMLDASETTEEDSDAMVERMLETSEGDGTVSVATVVGGDGEGTEDGYGTSDVGTREGETPDDARGVDEAGGAEEASEGTREGALVPDSDGGG